MRKLLLTGAVMFAAAGLGVLWTQPSATAAYGKALVGTLSTKHGTTNSASGSFCNSVGSTRCSS